MKNKEKNQAHEELAFSFLHMKDLGNCLDLKGTVLYAFDLILPKIHRQINYI